MKPWIARLRGSIGGAENGTEPGGQPGLNRGLEAIAILRLGKVGAVHGFTFQAQQKLLTNGHNLISYGQKAVGRALP